MSNSGKATFAALLALTLPGCDPGLAKPLPLPEKLTLPTLEGTELVSVADDLNIAVTATDAEGRSPGQPGYAGASRDGECRVYLDNQRPVTSDELYDLSFKHLDEAVMAVGGVEAIMNAPERIPTVKLWGDTNTRWHCILGAMHVVMKSGYPAVRLMVLPDVTENAAEPGGSVRSIDFELPYPHVLDAPLPEFWEYVDITASNSILLNNEMSDLDEMSERAVATLSMNVEPLVTFRVAPKASYGASLEALSIWLKVGNSLQPVISGLLEPHAFGKDESGVDPIQTRQ